MSERIDDVIAMQSGLSWAWRQICNRKCLIINGSVLRGTNRKKNNRSCSSATTLVQSMNSVKTRNNLSMS